MNLKKSKDILWNNNFISASLAYLLSTSAFYLFLPTIPLYLSEVLNVEDSKIGVVLSSYVLALLIVRPFSGYLVDNLPRKALYLIALCCFISIFFGYYFAATALFFIILRFIHGIFWAITSVSANTVAIDVIPSSRRTEGIGYFGVSSNIAMAIIPFIGVDIYKHFGFSALVTAALILGAISIVFVTFIKLPKKEWSNKQKQAFSFDRFIVVKALPIFFNQLFIAFSWGTLSAYAVLYGRELGITNPAYFFIFLSGGVILSRLFSGKLVDKGYLHQTIILAIAIISIGFLAFSALHTILTFNLSALLIGIGFGILLPALQTIYINMVPAKQRGTANSTYLTGFDLGIGIGMLAGGSIAQNFNGFASVFVTSSILAAIGLVLYILFSKKVYEKHKLK